MTHWYLYQKGLRSFQRSGYHYVLSKLTPQIEHPNASSVCGSTALKMDQTLKSIGLGSNEIYKCQTLSQSNRLANSERVNPCPNLGGQSRLLVGEPPHFVSNMWATEEAGLGGSGVRGWFQTYFRPCLAWDPASLVLWKYGSFASWICSLHLDPVHHKHP